MQSSEEITGRVASSVAAGYAQLRAGGFGVLLIGILTACDQGTPPTAPTDASPPAAHALMSDFAEAELAAASAGRTERGAEDEILRLEAQIPGVGGVFLDPATKRLWYCSVTALKMPQPLLPFAPSRVS